MKKIVLAAVLGAAMVMTAFTQVFTGSETQIVTASTGSERMVTFDDAVRTALDDAGLKKEDVVFNKKMRTYEDGMPVYEIQFLVPGEMKFEYVIEDGTGEIREKETEPWETGDDAEYVALLLEKERYFDFEAPENQIVVMPASSTLIDECAKERQTELAYYKDGMEYDDGRIVYVLGAMIPKEMKFEYTFDMKTGDVVESEKEEWKAEDNDEYREILETHDLSV